MGEQEKLLEMLGEMIEVGAAQGNRMTGKEVDELLGGQPLSQEQRTAIYQYLGEHGIAVEGYQYVPPAGKESREESGGTGGADGTADQARENLRRYEEELSGVSVCREQEEALILQYLQGDTSQRDRLVEMRLSRVMELAERYQERGVPREEIIAEGNLGLMYAMEIVSKNREEYLLPGGVLDREKYFGTLDLEVSHAMESFIDGETASRDWEQTVLAKINLIHQAAKHLAEETGKTPDVAELSEYTRIPQEEIGRILELSRDTKEMADRGKPGRHSLPLKR